MLEMKTGKIYFASDLEREGYHIANVYVFKNPELVERYGRIGIQYRKGTENLLFVHDSELSDRVIQFRKNDDGSASEISPKLLKLVVYFDPKKMKRAEIFRTKQKSK